MASVSKTAKDSIQAKFSAIAAGYHPVVGPEAQSKSYESLLESVATALGAKHRQTPLVNAGYAIRVASVCKQIQAFVSFHAQQQQQENKSSTLQLVHLGAGLDVTGLWSLSLDDSMEIHVIEVDTPEICAAKRATLLQLGLVEVMDGPVNDQQSVYLQGRPTNDGCASQSTYTLVATDLRELGAVQQALAFVRTDVPTLTISELVLTYLGESSCDDLLQYCASHLCQNSGSYVMAWEPLLPRENVSSTIEDYKRQYYQQFMAKLDRGVALEQEDRPTGAFAPLGSTCREVEQRLRRAGFRQACVITAGNAAVEARRAGVNLDSKELFDEHAALLLHLRSYTLACGFGLNADTLLQQTQCPWVFGVPPRALHLANDTAVWLTSIDAGDELQIRELFSQTYQDLSKEHISVRRMVKSALKTDLASTPPSDVTGNSAIGERFRDWKGAFIVAVQCIPENKDGTRSLRRRIIGGIGLRKCDRKEGLVRGSKPATYEICRLFVDPDFRVGGIGKYGNSWFARRKVLDHALTLCLRVMLQGKDYYSQQKTSSGENPRATSILWRQPLPFWIAQTHFTDPKVLKSAKRSQWASL
jgi:O-methyltransferase involved in polyketide biosynthesis/GNAT superfamily N-acetyltransferase